MAHGAGPLYSSSFPSQDDHWCRQGVHGPAQHPLAAVVARRLADGRGVAAARGVHALAWCSRGPACPTSPVHPLPRRVADAAFLGDYDIDGSFDLVSHTGSDLTTVPTGRVDDRPPWAQGGRTSTTITQPSSPYYEDATLAATTRPCVRTAAPRLHGRRLGGDSCTGASSTCVCYYRDDISYLQHPNAANGDAGVTTGSRTEWVDPAPTSSSRQLQEPAGGGPCTGFVVRDPSPLPQGRLRADHRRPRGARLTPRRADRRPARAAVGACSAYTKTRPQGIQGGYNGYSGGSTSPWMPRPSPTPTTAAATATTAHVPGLGDQRHGHVPAQEQQRALRRHARKHGLCPASSPPPPADPSVTARRHRRRRIRRIPRRQDGAHGADATLPTVGSR